MSRKQLFDMLLVIQASAWLLFATTCVHGQAVASFASVSTTFEFQEALRAGITHVVVNEHMDFTDSPIFSNDTVVDVVVLAVMATANGTTESIRGNCTGPPPFDVPEGAPAPRDNQCQLLIKEDFFEHSEQTGQLIFSNLYVLLAGLEKDVSTLFGLLGGDFYVTDSAFIGDGDKARTMSVKDNGRLYVRNSDFMYLHKDQMTAIRLAPGATAVIKDCRFDHNVVKEASDDDPVKLLEKQAKAAGPVIGLKSQDADLPSSVRFHNVTIGPDNVAPTPGNATVEHPNSRVFSDTDQPTVYDIPAAKEMTPWRLRLLPAGETAPQSVFTFEYLTEADPDFVRIVTSQADTTGLPQIMPEPLPLGTDYTVEEPREVKEDKDDDDDVALIAGLVAAGVALVAIFSLYFFCKRKKQQPAAAAPAVQASKPAEAEEDMKAAKLVEEQRDMTFANTIDGVPTSAYGNARQSMAHGPYGGAPYGAPQGGNYGGTNFLPTFSSATDSAGPDVSAVAVQSLPVTTASNSTPASDPVVERAAPPMPASAVPAAAAPQASASAAPPSAQAVPAFLLDSNACVVSSPPGTPAAAAAPSQVAAAPAPLLKREKDNPKTVLFDKTVMPNVDAEDVTHEAIIDALEELHSKKVLVNDRYELLGPVYQRLGGTGVVQYAIDKAAPPDTCADVAIKFFTRRAAFDRITSVHAAGSVSHLMSAIREILPNSDGSGLPPAIVMTRGEPLEDWVARISPNLPTSLNALCSIAELVKQLHAGGYVYYAIKPSNVAWFKNEKQWGLIDFACAARREMRTGLSFSLNYAPPEVITASAPTLNVDPAADIWALGVLAYELLSNCRTFRPGLATETIRNMISGKSPLPWEETDPSQLRTAKHSILSCLARDPRERPSASALHSSWSNLLDFAAVKHTEVAPAPQI